MTTMEKTVSDDLLQAFDNVMAAGASLPIAELKKRYAGSAHFRYSQHQLYKDLIDLPLSIGMVTGEKSSSVNKIVEGLKELYGDELVFHFTGRGDDAVLAVKLWKSDSDLRDLWTEFAEDVYKSEIHGGAA